MLHNRGNPMPRTIDKDTRLCMSLSGRPGNFGTRFHNFLYEALGLNFVYKAFTTQDLEGAVRGIRALGIRGCAVSMPFKEACIPMLDKLEASAAAIDSVNTIVNDDGFLRGFNTDYAAVASLLRTHRVPTDLSFVLRGSGGMAKAVACALRDGGYKNGVIAARNEMKGRTLADICGYAWRKDADEEAHMLVNVTPIGMAGGPESDELAFSQAQIARAQFVFDVVAVPSETPLICAARAQKKAVITGADVIVLQAVEQFVLYTGVRPCDTLIAQAAVHAQG